MPQVKAGDRVLFSSYAGERFKLGERELLLMHENDILAIDRSIMPTIHGESIRRRRNPLMAKMIAFDQEARDALRAACPSWPRR